MGTPEQNRKRRWRKRHLIELMVAVVAVVVVGVALADQVAVDGDTAKTTFNIAYADTSSPSARACSDTRNAIAGNVRVSYNGNTHYNSGSTVTVTVTPSAAATTAGITATGGSATVPSGTSWDGSGDFFDIAISTTVPSTVANATYSIAVKTSGAATQTTGQGSSAVNPYEPNDSYTVGVNCTAAPPSNTAPIVDAGGPYSGGEGSNIALSGASASDTDGPGPLSYLWTIDNSSVGTGSCSLSNATSLATATINCTDNGTATVKLTATEAGPGLSTSATASVTINNVAPSGTFNSPAGNVNEGSSFNLSITGVTDPSSIDTAAGFTYAFDCGAGYGAFSAASSTSCPTTDDATLSVGGKVMDKDGGTSTYTGSVTVVNVAPTITSASFGTSNVSCGTGNASLTVNFTDPGTADTHIAEVDWDNDGTYDETVDPFTSGSSISHTYATAGSHTAKVRVTDDDGGVSNVEPDTVTVNYNTSGILQPVNDTRNGQPMSVFKYKSTIPVKIRITDCDGSVVSNLAPTVAVQKINSSPPPLGSDEASSTVPPTTGTTMRFTGDPDYQYIYNLATKPLADSSAQYRITITIQTGQTVTADIGLKP